MLTKLPAYRFRRTHLEGFFWIASLIALASFSPGEEGHASLCLISNLDLGFCPGCGLGHSIAWFFRGELYNSFHAHPLGIPAVIILLHRIYIIFKADILLSKTQDHGKNFSNDSGN